MKAADPASRPDRNHLFFPPFRTTGSSSDQSAASADYPRGRTAGWMTGQRLRRWPVTQPAVRHSCSFTWGVVIGIQVGCGRLRFRAWTGFRIRTGRWTSAADGQGYLDRQHLEPTASPPRVEWPAWRQIGRIRFQILYVSAGRWRDVGYFPREVGSPGPAVQRSWSVITWLWHQLRVSCLG